MRVIPSGADAEAPPTKARRAAIRRRFGLGEEALVYGCFGIIHPNKGSVETVEAFAPVAARFPDARLIFVGKDLSYGLPLEKADALGIRANVRFLGPQSDRDFKDLMSAVDVGIALRRPPTAGETSAALLHLMRWGIPTVVSDVGTFSDYPSDVVRKVPWNDVRQDDLTEALLDMA